MLLERHLERVRKIQVKSELEEERRKVCGLEGRKG